MVDSTVVDLAFPVHGDIIPADHGYPLFAAVARHWPSLHGDEAVGIHPIRGQLIGERHLALTRQSQLIFRLSALRIPEAIRLAGRSLDLNGAQIRVGVPTVRALTPAPALYSRLVIIKGYQEAEAFLEAARHQLVQLGIQGKASLIPRHAPTPFEGRAGGADPVVRRTTRIRGKEVVGFAVRVDDLDSEASLRLQAAGLGGRRRFGCGIFIPVRGMR